MGVPATRWSAQAAAAAAPLRRCSGLAQTRQPSRVLATEPCRLFRTGERQRHHCHSQSKPGLYTQRSGPAATVTLQGSRRLFSTTNARQAGWASAGSHTPANRPRSWRNLFLRLTLAGAVVFWYQTSTVFAETPDGAIQRLEDSIHHVQESSLPTVDAIVEEKQRRRAERAAIETAKLKHSENGHAPISSSPELDGATSEDAASGQDGEDLGNLEGEASQQGAFNEETGEINWDCPCLGGMAHGPCGDEFKAAFSCFVYSKEEPKGMECIDKFKGMQDCFRAHPEVYASELEDDEQVEQDYQRQQELEREIEARERSEGGEVDAESATPPRPLPNEQEPQLTDGARREEEKSATRTAPTTPSQRGHRSLDKQGSQTTTAQVESLHQTNAPNAEVKQDGDEGGDLVPKAVHDARSSHL